MKTFIEKVINFLKNLNQKADKVEDGLDSSVSKLKESKLSKSIKGFFNNSKVKKIFTVLSWILFAMIIYLSLSFITHPLTFLLFIVLAIMVMPTFNNFLKNKKIIIARWKKIILFIIIFVITILTAPIDENGNLYKGIEGIDFKLSNNQSVILNNADLKVVPYGVNYYYDNILTTSEKYEANLNDVITFYEDKSQDGKYELVTENNFPLEITSESLKDNMINIYYKTKETTTQTTSIPETTETVSENEVTEEAPTSSSEVEWSAQTVTSSTYEEVKDMLGKKVDSSTKNVVYTVEYIYDGEIEDSLTEYFVVPLGSKVKDCTLNDKEGYKYVETENCPLEVTDNNQTIKVKYDLISTEEPTTEPEKEETEASTQTTENPEE